VSKTRLVSMALLILFVGFLIVLNVSPPGTEFVSFYTFISAALVLVVGEVVK
jgi:hypothetical protein